jgi:GMP synthase (glutamine-hydrolysing)
VYQWHREGFDLPSSSDLIAEGDAFPVQAFRHGACAYGIQFHPEVTHAMMCRWTTRGHARMEMPGAKQRAAHFEDRAVHDFAIRTWLSDFLDHWTGHAQADIRAAAGSREHMQPRASTATAAPLPAE